jgi:hypothetical protein
VAAPPQQGATNLEKVAGPHYDAARSLAGRSPGVSPLWFVLNPATYFPRLNQGDLALNAPGTSALPLCDPVTSSPSPSRSSVDECFCQVQAARTNCNTMGDYLRFALVSAYLGTVGFLLVITRRAQPRISFRRLVRALLRPRQPMTPMTGIVHDSGHCYRVLVDPSLLSDAESISRIQLYENELPLPHGHTYNHDVIRTEGSGAYSHWSGTIYFSATDNSDPRSNGRRYTYAEEQG